MSLSEALAAMGDGRQALDGIAVRPATKSDTDYVISAIEGALHPYYGGDHRAHAVRLIRTHLEGGVDPRGSLSSRQMLLVLWQGGRRRGVLNLVVKRQDTCKISPLIIHPQSDATLGLGSVLLKAAEEFATTQQVRQLYCTVAERNSQSLEFFLRNGFIVCGHAPDQYKTGEREVFLRKPLPATTTRPPPSTISVTLATSHDWPDVRRLLLDHVRNAVQGATDEWLDSLRRGTRYLEDLEEEERHPAWVYVARDRASCVRAATIIGRKKGEALKVMPIAATDPEGFEALVIDLPSLLDGKGRKAYIHLVPSASEVAMLQAHGWKVEALLPGAYHADAVTQQWAFSLQGSEHVRTLRIREEYLRMIANGSKTLEIRVAYEHLRSIKAGDNLRLLSSTSEVQCSVLEVRCYPSFGEMLDNEDSQRALPDMKPGEALQRLREIYPPAKERLGILVIELQVADIG